VSIKDLIHNLLKQNGWEQNKAAPQKETQKTVTQLVDTSYQTKITCQDEQKTASKNIQGPEAKEKTFPNEEQKQIIEHLEGPCLVLAPVGTGKTKTMAARLAAALERGFVPERTLCLTFTNRACYEIRERIKTVLDEKAGQVNIFTFHALCAWMLRLMAEDLGLPTDFVIFDEEDSIELFIELGFLQTEKYQQRRNCARDLLEHIYRIKADAPPGQLFNCFSEEEIAKSLNLQCSLRSGSTFTKLIQEYHRHLRIQNALDFADLVYFVRTALHLLPEQRRYWESRFDWIQVDEIQDVHLSEYEIVSILAKRTKNLALFGDLDQTIYEWRGSNPRELVNRFRKEFYPVKEFQLSYNYRGTKKLVELADNFANSFEKRYTKKLTPASYLPSGEEVILKEHSTYSEEAEWVAQEVKRITSDNQTTPRIAILARSNNRARFVSEVFEKNKIDHITVEEYEFFRRQEIKDMIARVRFLLNPDDASALRRCLLRPQKVGPDEIASIEKLASYGLSLVDLANPRTYETGEPFAALLKAWDSGDVVILDCETTGLLSLTNEVIEIAALRAHSGQICAEFHRYICPTVPVGKSESVHGYSDSFLREHGHDAHLVFKEFRDFVNGAHVVGHNVRFDMTSLKYHARRVGVNIKFSHWDDTLKISQRFVRTERYDLKTLQKCLNLAHVPTHNAMDDALCTYYLLEKLISELKKGHLQRKQSVERYGHHFKPFAQQFARWRELAETEAIRPPELLQIIIDESGLKEYYEKKREMRRLQNLRELINYFHENDDKNLPTIFALEELVRKASLARNLDLLALDDARVVVTTVHQVKGLEFDVVFVVGLTEGEFPNFFSEREGLLEEEKRLFYVAITRPRERLYLSWHRKNEKGFTKNRSRFLNSIN